MTKTDRLIAYISSHGPTPAARLAEVADLPNSGRVYALLKTYIESGRVAHIRGRYAISPDWDESAASELRDARILLERAGYRIVRDVA
jgi:hypothetical protein